MNIHKNARLTPLRREEMALAVMEGRLSQAQAASRYAVTAMVVKRWGERHGADGRADMADRWSRPRCSPKATAGAVAERIVALRRQRLHGQAHRKCGRRLAGGGEPGAGRDCRG